MSNPEYKKLIWNPPERLTDDKMKQLTNNFSAMRYLYNRTPKGIVSMIRSEDPLVITDNGQVIQSLSVTLKEGRAYRIKVVQNCVFWVDDTSTLLHGLYKDGVLLCEKYIKALPTQYTGGTLYAKSWDANYALEYLLFNKVAGTYLFEHKISNPFTSMPGGINWKVDVASLGVDDIIETTQTGDYYIIVTDIGVIDF